MSDTEGYKNIFKSTFLFGFVQIFNIAIKVGLNKAVALILGPVGMGVISLYNTTIHFLSTGAGLGINQSALRDISDARGKEDKFKIDYTISFVKQIIRYTSVFGILITIILSPFLSEWAFDSKEHIWGFILISLVVGATIQTNGFRAINTGMRELRNVAYSTMWGSLGGLLSGIPFYIWLRDRGIVPSLIVSSIITLLIAKYYADKVKYIRIKLSIKQALRESSGMIKMGISLMLMSFMLTLVQLIISAYINFRGGLSTVGIYQAGATIVTSYFGIIITAMSTEYYPRISSFHENNSKLKRAVNDQSEIGLLLALPLVVLFIFLAPYFIEILYSSQFIGAVSYLDYAIVGTVTIICSNAMGMILLAKQNNKAFLISSIIGNGIILGITIVLYNYLDIRGLGIAYMINGIMQFLLYQGIMSHLYQISFSKRIYLLLISIYGCIFISICARQLDIEWTKWSLGIGLLLLTSCYSVIRLNKLMDLNLPRKIISLFKR